MIFVRYQLNNPLFMAVHSTSNEKLEKTNIEIDFEKEYQSIIKKACEFAKYTYPIPPVNSSREFMFKKFSLYQDSPNSITSFNTDASF